MLGIEMLGIEMLGIEVGDARRGEGGGFLAQLCQSLSLACTP